MTAAAISAARWTAVRDAVADYSARLTSVLRSLPDGQARAVGDWTVAETAAHVVVVAAFEAWALFGDTDAVELEDLIPIATEPGFVDVGHINSLALQYERVRDTTVLADRLRYRIDRLLAGSAPMNGAERVAWLGGVEVSAAAVLGHQLGELMVHGHDIARAAGHNWTIDPPAAALTFELFFADLMHGLAAVDVPPDSPLGAPFSVEFRVAGTSPLQLRSDGRRLTVGEPNGPVDARVGGDAAANLLLMFGRVNPLGALLRRQITIAGRRPWRLRHLKAMAP